MLRNLGNLVSGTSTSELAKTIGAAADLSIAFRTISSLQLNARRTAASHITMRRSGPLRVVALVAHGLAVGVGFAIGTSVAIGATPTTTAQRDDPLRAIIGTHDGLPTPAAPTLTDIGELPLQLVSHHLNARDFTRLGAVSKDLSSMTARFTRNDRIQVLRQLLDEPSMLVLIIRLCAKRTIDDVFELLERKAMSEGVWGYYAHDPLLKALRAIDPVDLVSPLIAAVERHDEHLVRRLIAMGARLHGAFMDISGNIIVRAPHEVANALGMTATRDVILLASILFVEVSTDNVPEARAILTKEPWLVTVRDALGRTPLHLAQSVEMMHLLAGDFQAPVNVYDAVDSSPLTTAIRLDSVACVDYLLLRGAHVYIIKSTRAPLLLAIEVAGMAVVQALLNRLPSDSTPGVPTVPFQMHVGVHSAQLFTHFSAEATRSPVLPPPLHHAIFCRRGDVIRILLQKGADANKPFGSLRPIHLAALSGNRFAVDVLVAAGADPLAPTDKQMLPLHFAVMSGNIPAIGALLSAHGTWHINAKDENGSTPLFYACIYGTHAIVRFLVYMGADPNIANYLGQTPLLAAAGGVNPTQMLMGIYPHPFVDVLLEAKRLATVKLLVKHGADVSILGTLAADTAHMLGRHKIASYITRLLGDMTRTDSALSRDVV